MLKLFTLVAYILCAIDLASGQTPYYQGKTITIIQAPKPVAVRT